MKHPALFVSPELKRVRVCNGPLVRPDTRTYLEAAVGPGVSWGAVIDRVCDFARQESFDPKENGTKNPAPSKAESGKHRSDVRTSSRR